MVHYNTLIPRRRGGGGGSGGGSGSGGSSCSFCDRSTYFYVEDLASPPMAAAMAFAAMNLIAFVVLLGFAHTVRPWAAPNAARGRLTRFGLISALWLTIGWQIIDTVDVALSGIPVSIPLGYLIAEIFAQLFVIAGETAIVYCIFGFLFSRLHDSARLGKGVRIAGISATALLGALGAARLSLYTTWIANSLGADVDTSLSQLIRSYRALVTTFDAIRFVFAIASLAIGIYVLIVSRRETTSKIPIILLATTLPFQFFTTLADVVLDSIYYYGNTYVGITNFVAREIVIGLFTVVVLAGLVAAGKCHDWTDAPSPSQYLYQPGPQPGGQYGAYGPGMQQPQPVSAYGATMQQQQQPMPPGGYYNNIGTAYGAPGYAHDANKPGFAHSTSPVQQYGAFRGPSPALSNGHPPISPHSPVSAPSPVSTPPPAVQAYQALGSAPVAPHSPRRF